jgi:prepilin-type N-terminal cleavage/methylation domain-containing protein
MNSQKGFTLLELLLGLLIFSIIGTIVYSVFAGGILISRRSEGRGVVFRDGRTALELLARELENMVDYRGPLPEDHPGAFDGREDGISFLLPTGRGLRRVRYFLEEPAATRIHETVIGRRTARNVNLVFHESKSGRLRYLVREEDDFFPDGADGVAQKQVILTAVKPDGLKFRFGYVEGMETKTYLWKNQWGRDGIPANVRVELTLADADDNDREFFLDYNILVPHGRQGSDEAE